ncbi:MAG TPA: peptidase S13 [Leucothrix sp.]|nr:peptidase S13 [Leucothrix sp.]
MKKTQYLSAIIFKWVLLIAFFLSSAIPALVQAKSGLQTFSKLSNAGLFMQDARGKPIESRHANKAYIPASTTKLVTAWLALNHWGENHRFSTNFYWEAQTRTLFIKGSGDPFLVSEEIKIIANHLKRKGIRQVDTIVLDTSIFQNGLIMPGTGKTNNPYDAVPSAIAANFNTIYVKRVNHAIHSAEAQTPLTSFARDKAKRYKFKNKKLRINTGRNPKDASYYFAEILSVFMQLKNTHIAFGNAPTQQPIYIHQNSKTVGEMIKPMMKYSTNFIANQLVLKMSQETFKRPANKSDVATFMKNRLLKKFPHWGNKFALKDGAGLSRGNRLSPKQLVDLLHDFRPWAHLLPEIEKNVYAKSGTLNGVSTLAGYIKRHNQYEPFALMMNQRVPYRLRNKIARELAQR